MKILRGKLLDDGIWLDGFIFKTAFKKIFRPFDPNCGFDYQVLKNKDENKLWEIIKEENL